MKKNAFIFFVVLLILMAIIQGCNKTLITPTPGPVVVTKPPYSSATIFVGLTSVPPSQMTLTPPISDPNTVVVSLSIYNQPPTQILMKFKQKLYVIPPLGWGEFGWDLEFDKTFFQLDLKNEPKWPSQGWWIWTPLRTGQSSISIKAIPPPCMNSDPPCAFPEYSVNLNVVVGQ